MVDKHVSFSQNDAWQNVDVVVLRKTIAAVPWAIVEFWATDCLFSRLIKPVRERLTHRYFDRVALLRCGTAWGKEDELNDDWGVWALPAIVLFRKGHRIHRWIGAIQPCLIVNSIDGALARYRTNGLKDEHE